MLLALIGLLDILTRNVCVNTVCHYYRRPAPPFLKYKYKLYQNERPITKKQLNLIRAPLVIFVSTVKNITTGNVTSIYLP